MKSIFSFTLAAVGSRCFVIFLFLLTFPATGRTTLYTTAPSAIPLPPRQGSPWTPPSTTLSPVVVSAMEELFRDGLSDPRGCEYREIEVIESGNWSIKTHGWVLPGNRFGIGWNGVVYPLKSIGAKVDLEKEIASLPTGPIRYFRGNHNGWPMSDSGSLRLDNALPLQVALLLRLGHGDLAGDIWRQGYANDDSGKAGEDPLPDLANLWLGRFYNQAMVAYANRDYDGCSDICRHVASAEAKVADGVRRRGGAWPSPDKTNVEQLWQLPILQKESDRRLQETPFQTVLESGQPASGPERIAALIRDLETVSVQQVMNPGETDPTYDPTVQELIKQGYPAVEPLLKCFAEDDRLTETRFTAGMGYEGGIIPVYQAAYVALRGILNLSVPLYQTTSVDTAQQTMPRAFSPEARQAVAQQIEAVWLKHKGRDESDVAFATLQDDNAGVEEWLKAIDAIVQPADGTFTTYRLAMPANGSWRQHPDDTPFTPVGESLRRKTNPSVADLIIRRFEPVLHDKTGGFFAAATPGKMLLALADWDGKNHLDDLRRLGAELETASSNRFDKSMIEGGVVALDEKRLRLGDSRALHDYVDWLLEQPRAELGSAAFTLMWEHPDDPMVQQAADKLFTDPAHPWAPLSRSGSGGATDLLTTPMLGLAAYRHSVEDALGDKSVIGKVGVFANGNFSVTFGTDTQGENYTPPEGQSLTPIAFSSSEVRLCDYYASRISKVDGFPACGLNWTEVRRNAAVAACREFLRRYGDHFKYRASDTDFRQTDTGVVSIHFPKLDHPATPQDVRDGNAIFSLPGTTRLCAFPAIPTIAWRPSRPMDAEIGSTTGADGKNKQVTLYNTRGWIWQAEETLIDGKWQRFYGFVGRYQMEKVPAAEIDFDDAGYGRTPAVPALTANLQGLSQFEQGQFTFSYLKRQFFPPTAPLPVTLTLRNHSGLDQTVPRGLLPAPSWNALPPGIQLVLSYSEKIPPRVLRITEPQFVFGPWKPVDPRIKTKFVPSSVNEVTLGPTQKLDILKIDLRDYFDTSRAGVYRLQASIKITGQTPSKSNELTFCVAPKAE